MAGAGRAFDEALATFVSGIMNDQALMAAVENYDAGLIEPGRTTSLAMKLLQLTTPGIPDTYQGTELWDLRSSIPITGDRSISASGPGSPPSRAQRFAAADR